MKKLFLALALVTGSGLFAVGRPYWPLEHGARWELQSGREQMAFEVTGRDGDIYEVRWDNPWVKATFGFRVSGDKIMLATLDMGQGVVRMPADTAYFDFTRNQGESWSNVLGTITTLRRGGKVSAPAGSYSDTITIRARDTKKTDTFWTFAAGVGPVQFGEGRGAFLLTNYRPGAAAESSAPPTAREDRRDRDRGRRPSPRDPVQPPYSTPSGTTLVGIDANPSSNEGYSDNAKSERARIARKAGASFLYYAPKWNELEPREGKYNFSELDHKVAVAKENGWPIALNIRVVDTNNRAMPGPYQRWAFDDPKTAERLRRLITEMSSRLQGTVRWIEIGNEVNEYFKSHRGELAGYRKLLDQVMPDVRQKFPGAKFSVNFTFFAAPTLDREYGDLLSLCDFVSITYYP
ncbi:MAG TPA: beta-galactosidase, partial [Bryobacteraceae bacterium]|nr:beta-galactosidase [Bryobacteraceae bacterium]